MKFVIIGGKLYNLNSTEIKLDYSVGNLHYDLKGLERFRNLEYLSINGADCETMRKLPSLKQLKVLWITYSDLSDSDVLGKFESINTIHCLNCNFTFTGRSDSNIKKLELLLCNIEGIGNFGNYENLSDLWIMGAYAPYCEYVMPDNKEDKSITLDEGVLYLDDSSGFASLDGIRSLVLTDIIIRDISGFLEMDNLEELDVSRGFISEEQKATLQNKGISVSDD